MRKKVLVGGLVVTVFTVCAIAYLAWAGWAGFGGTEFVPEEYGIFSPNSIINDNVQINKHPLKVNMDIIGLTGTDPVISLKKCNNYFIYWMGDKLSLDNQIFLSRLEWQETAGDPMQRTHRSIKMFLSKDEIPCYIYPNYAENSEMYKIVPKVALEPGYYAFHYGQLENGLSLNQSHNNIAFDFIIMDDSQSELYQKAAKLCQDFWKLMMEKDYRKLAEISCKELGTGILNSKFDLKELYLRSILDWVSMEKKRRMNDLVTGYEFRVRLDKMSPFHVLKGDIYIPFEIEVKGVDYIYVGYSMGYAYDKITNVKYELFPGIKRW